MGGGALRVLIVEDDPSCTDLYTWYLQADREYAFEPIVVDTASAALELCRREPPDCLVLDFQLPDMTGLAVLQELAGPSGTIPFAVVMVSAHASTELATAALRAGALDCLDKTRVTEAGLRRAVRTAIEKARLQAQVEAQRREVAEQARRTRQILERITDGFFAIDRSWRFTYANPIAEQTFVQGQRSLLGERLLDLFPSLVGSPIHARLSAALEGGEAVSFETLYEPRGIWLEVHAYPDADGLSVYFHDITARKQAEAERERQLVRGQTLLRVVRGFAAEGDPRRLVASIAEEALRLLGGDQVVVARWNDDTEGLVPIATAASEKGAGEPAESGSATLDLAVKRRRPVIVNEPNRSARSSERAVVAGAVTAASVAAPLMDEGRLIGAISITTTDPRRRFSVEDAQLLEILAGLAAATIVGHEEARLEGVLLSARTAQHELNNRLALVRGYAEILADHPDLPPDVRQQAQEIVRGARSAADILRRLGKLDALREVEWGTGLRPTLDLGEPPI